ncbi:MAG: PAS domain S-box protein, partial [Verrucomicrobiota bacterium]
MIQDFSDPHWHRAEERFRLLVENVKDYAIFMLDPEGLIVSWNAGATRIKGYQPHEILGAHFSCFYTPEDIAAQRPAQELAIALAEGRVEDKGWRIRKDGSRFWADVVITPLRDPVTDELRGFGKVTRDLTDQKYAEERLQHSEEQFRLLVEGVTEYAIFMTDPAGYIVTWNSGAERAKGYLATEIIGKHIEQFYLPEDRANGKPARLLGEAKKNRIAKDQGIRVRKDGTLFHADVLITAIYDKDGNHRGFTKVTRDVTDQVRSREIDAARRAAEKASQAKDQFLAVLSHELRTPLTPIVAGLSYLIENISRIEQEELLETLGTMQRNVLLEAQLIDDILDLTRISRGKIELRFEAVDMRAVLQDVLGICQQEITIREQRVSSQLEAPEYWVWADPTRIRQVFWNLINNAVKFTPKGGSISIRAYSNRPEQL